MRYPDVTILITQIDRNRSSFLTWPWQLVDNQEVYTRPTSFQMKSKMKKVNLWGNWITLIFPIYPYFSLVPFISRYCLLRQLSLQEINKISTMQFLLASPSQLQWRTGWWMRRNTDKKQRASIKLFNKEHRTLCFYYKEKDSLRACTPSCKI